MNNKQREGTFKIFLIITILFGILSVFSTLGNEWTIILIFSLIFASFLVMTFYIVLLGDRDEEHLRYKINKKRRKLN